MYWQKHFKRNNPDEKIERIIKEIFDENDGNYGYRRIDMELRKRGFTVNHKKILRIMNKLEITCVKFRQKSRKYSTYRGTIGRVAKNRFIVVFIRACPIKKSQRTLLSSSITSRIHAVHW